ncbi:MAG: lamin tail domain-containing protein [Candidatus Cloacimonetes bacterium]|nr:lamin tail domain-containing protein [Candidatus Cloacimonadota bacterium]
MNKIFLVITLLVFISLSADTNFTIMSYNALNFDQNSSSRTSYFKQIIEYNDPDIIVMQEIVDQNGANLLLNAFNQINNEYAASAFIDGFDTDNILYFKSAVFALDSQNVISTNLRDISEYVLVVNDHEFRVYSCHLKASSGTTNEQQRYQEILQLRSHIESLPAGTEYVIAGDMNFYSDDEPAYENLTITAPLLSEDICTQVGNWHNNSSFSTVHTQSTCESGGGMDDKFDFLFASNGMNDNAGIDFIPNSFESFGNDGNHFNQSINSGTNSAVPSNIADALFEASDHLPVIAEFIAFGCGSQPLSDPIISEYIEGSSLNKAIEIFNPNNEQMYLAAYSLQKDVNGDGNWVNTYNLSGILAAGDVFVLANSQADPQILAVVDDTDDGVINFNGDDQVRLTKNGVEIDRIGIPGDVTFGQNVTYVRKPDFIIPQSGPQDPRNNGEWDSYPEDTFSYLGSHTALIPPDPPENVNIEILPDTDQVKLTWINEGLTYKIYSNTDPGIPFSTQNWNFEISVINVEQVILDVNGNSRYFIITAE